jgi:copper chaperone NosL
MSLFGFKKSGFIAVLLAFCTLMLSGCRKSEMPAPIKSGDECQFCKSRIEDASFTAEFLSTSGSLYKFDDMGCLIASAKSLGRESIASIYVMDNKSMTLTPAETAFFVRSDKIWTPKGGGLIAFKDASEAQNLASRYHAELLKFNELMK